MSRVWLDNQSSSGYRLAFHEVAIGKTLEAIVLDWSDAQINGLKAAISESQATALIKGCKVHWLRSCQRVADKVTSNSSL